MVVGFREFRVDYFRSTINKTTVHVNMDFYGVHGLRFGRECSDCFLWQCRAKISGPWVQWLCVFRSSSMSYGVGLVLSCEQQCFDMDLACRCLALDTLHDSCTRELHNFQGIIKLLGSCKPQYNPYNPYSFHFPLSPASSSVLSHPFGRL